VQTCYRHPDRRAGVVCQRCDRPICPDCMHQASVGFHCPECAKAGAQRVLRPDQLISRPVVVVALVAINATVFLWDMVAPADLNFEGGLFGPFVALGDWWRVITSGFLHVSLIHVGFNCFLLYQLGMLLEPALGRLRFSLVYLCALLGGSFGALLLTPDALTVGASGGVFGLMGAAIVALRSRGVDIFSTGLGGLLVLNLVLTFVIPRISIGGHIGGLAAGFVAGWILVELGPRTSGNTVVPAVLVGMLSAGLFAGSLLVV
jgi:membrane associated rhomboid family serine protease